jgi:hypothetical protein
MKMPHQTCPVILLPLIGFFMLLALPLTGCDPADPQAGEHADTAGAPTDTSKPPADDRVDLVITLPQPRFAETPKNLPKGLTEIEPPFTSPRPALQVEPGLSNVALGKPVTASDDFPAAGEPPLVTDGDKEALEGRSLVLGPKQQWVTIDLGQPFEIHAIAIWRNHRVPHIYYDVIVELAGEEDEDFIDGSIVFNNDRDGSAGKGVGEDLPYWEGFEGKLIPVDRKVARYVRVYSSGSTHNMLNSINEVEVYGKASEQE